MPVAPSFRRTAGEPGAFRCLYVQDALRGIDSERFANGCGNKAAARLKSSSREEGAALLEQPPLARRGNDRRHEIRPQPLRLSQPAFELLRG